MSAREEKTRFDHRRILGMRVDAVSYDEAVKTVLCAVSTGQGGYVCACNVHMVMEGYDDPHFQSDVNRALLVVPDGMPLVWAMQLLGVARQTRVYGPELMRHITAAALTEGIRVGLFGTTDATLEKLRANLTGEFAGLDIAYAKAPAFTPWGERENAEILDDIAEAGARIVFVALGCPKQERWMAAHAAKTHAVLVGVGAAFDFYAGNLPMAPPLLQRAGMEWAFRWASDCKRLSRRYLKHNPRFVIYFLAEYLRGAFTPDSR